MTLVHEARYVGPSTTGLAAGWTFERLTPPSRLFGANGLRTGPDGRVYVAQVAGSQISALDVNTGQLSTVSAKGSDIVAPDDLAFDPSGELYITEYYDGRVSVRGDDGSTRVVRDDLPGANGITFHQGRLFVNECRIGGRLLEVPLDGSAPKVLLSDLPMPNAMEVGPDGKLYFPQLGTGDIWRIDPDGGEPERVVGDLIMPVAVKFDSQGNIVAPQVGSGQVVRIDPRSGEKTQLAQLTPGLDNLTFVGDRLFVSHFSGEIVEITGVNETREVLPGGLNWPLDLTVGADGTLFLTDGTFFFHLPAGGSPETIAMLFTPGYPGYIRGVQAIGAGEFIVTTGNGEVARWNSVAGETEVLASGLDQLYGVTVAPGGAIVAAELGTGRVLSIRPDHVEELASGLDGPRGVAFGPGGALYVSESRGGRVVEVTSGKVETVVEGLGDPQGILVLDGTLYVVDSGAKTVVAVDLETRQQTVIASALPLGAPEGVEPKPLKGLAPFSGPQGPFAGIAAAPDGNTLYVSGDADGSVLALRRNG